MSDDGGVWGGTWPRGHHPPQLLLDDGAHVNADGGCALQAAEFLAHVRLLLDMARGGRQCPRRRLRQCATGCLPFWTREHCSANKGADTNAPGSEKGNALHVAARRVRRASFGCCWRKGQTNEFYSSALCAAARCAHENIIQLLLVNGPRVGVLEGKFGSALLIAASDGHESTIGLLLEKGPT
jgi:hypothetical protein